MPVDVRDGRLQRLQGTQDGLDGSRRRAAAARRAAQAPLDAGRLVASWQRRRATRPPGDRPRPFGGRPVDGAASPSSAWTTSPAGCGAIARGIASRTSARSSPTRSRRPTSWPTPRTAATTPSSSTSSATSSFRSTSWPCCSRSAAPATCPGRGRARHPEADPPPSPRVRRDRGRRRPGRCCATGTRSSATSPDASRASSARCPRTSPRCCTPARSSAAPPRRV